MIHLGRAAFGKWPLSDNFTFIILFMKRVSLLLVATFSLLVFMSCNASGPKKVAEKWLTAFLHLNYDEAEQYSTPETINVLKLFKSLDSKTLNDSAMKEAQKITVDIKKVVEDGNNATITYTSTLIPDEQTIYMVKQNGEWLVQLTKEDIFKDGAKPLDPDSDPNIVADTTTTQVAGDTSAADITSEQKPAE
jgi:hypothetical protein